MKSLKLSSAELDTLMMLWEIGEPTRASVLLTHMLPTHSWSISTLQTLLARLEEKGAVCVTVKKRTRYFAPTLSKEEYMEDQTGSLMESLKDCSPVSLMAGLIRGGRLCEEELDEIAALLQRAKQELQRKKG